MTTRAQFDAALTTFDAAAYAAMPSTTDVPPTSSVPTFPAALDDMEDAAPQWVSPYNGAIRTAETFDEYVAANNASQPGDIIYPMGTIKSNVEFPMKPSIAVMSAPGEPPAHLIGTLRDGGGTADLFGMIRGLIISQDADQQVINKPCLIGSSRYTNILANELYGGWDNNMTLYGGNGTQNVEENYIHDVKHGHGVYTHHAENHGIMLASFLRNLANIPGEYWFQAYSGSAAPNPNTIQDYLLQDNVTPVGNVTIGAPNAQVRRFVYRHNASYSGAAFRVGYVDIQNEDIHFIDNDIYLAKTIPLTITNFLVVEDVNNHLSSVKGIVVSGTTPPVQMNAPAHHSWLVPMVYHPTALAQGALLPDAPTRLLDLSNLALVVGKSYQIVNPVTDAVLVAPFPYTAGFQPTLPTSTSLQAIQLKAA
jgi:hypothetical protein